VYYLSLFLQYSVSDGLHEAFRTLLASPHQRGLIAGIEHERIVLRTVIPCTPSSSSSSSATTSSSSGADDDDAFAADVAQLAHLLNDRDAAYVVLRRYNASTADDRDAPDACVAVTYVPDAAPVRQKMLFASSRLALVRELGAERFRATLFATSRADLTPQGFRQHERHEQQ
jgi:twinfilin-like protein